MTDDATPASAMRLCEHCFERKPTRVLHDGPRVLHLCGECYKDATPAVPRDRTRGGSDGSRRDA